MTKHVKEEYLIKSEQELVSKFLSESVGIYIKNKNNEHTGVGNNEELKKDVKEDLGNLLDGLGDYTSGLDPEKVKGLISIFRDNLDGYISGLDKELTDARDAYLLAHHNFNPNSITLDEAMVHVAQESSFVKMSQKLEEGAVSGKDTGWKKLADFFKAVGIPKLADFFEQKNEESKMANQAKPMAEALKILGVKELPSKAGITSTAHTVNALPRVRSNSQQR